jgi:hypothetical protein
MADRQTIHDNEFISIYYYPDKKIIHHEFHQRAKGQTLQDAFTAGAELMEKIQCEKWLSDDRKNSVYAEEDRNWSATHFRPRVIKAGMKFWAVLLPEKAIGQLNMREVIKVYEEKGVTIKIFQDAVEAMKWLESQ